MAGMATAAEKGEMIPSAAKDIPTISYVDTEGETIALSDHKGKVVVLHFWAKWCPPCIEELPEMVAMLDTLDAKDKQDLVVLPLSLDRNAETVHAFLEEHALPLPVTRDAGGKAMRALEIRGLPSTVILNRNGQEIARREGVVNWENPAVKEMIMDAGSK